MNSLKYADYALNVIKESRSKNGFLASSLAIDNYNRVWSRDSMMTGIACLMFQFDEGIAAFKDSIVSLVEHQAKDGQIPSNVKFGNEVEVSFGKLVGRVDATTWWLVGVGLYLQETKDEILKNKLVSNIEKAINILETWEMNHRGLIFTPLGGNWADEYISQGYVLYDQLLRIWALRILGKVYSNAAWTAKSAELAILVRANFAQNDSGEKYHPFAYDRIDKKRCGYMWHSLGPQGYDQRWDMAANALALLLNINEQPLETEKYVKELAVKFDHWMLPVFFPVIDKDDADWHLLSLNYSYSFKNKPYQFHNGGAWPIFLGWLSLGFAKNGLNDIPKKIAHTYIYHLTKESPAFSFFEYYDSSRLKPQGVNKLCYSACGLLLMLKAIHFDENNLNRYFA